MSDVKILGSESIIKLLAKYSIPAVIAMLVNAIYNVVDRIFIGQYAGESALAGLTVVFPVMMIIFAFASLIGIGGSSLLAIKLGENNLKAANHVFGNTIVFGLMVTAITLISVFFNLEGLLVLFGATPDVIGYSMSYMTIILGGFIFQMVSFILNSTVRTEGKPMLSMLAMLSSAITNIILDYVFIGVLGMGVSGAALATIIGQFAGLSILLSYFLRGKSHLRLTSKDLIPDFQVISNIVMIGFASFISTIGTSVAMALINRGLGQYGGTSAITAMGAINSLYTFFIMPVMGITQGMQPIIGYNYGAKLGDRVKETLKYGLMIGTVFSVFVFAVLQMFPESFVGLFLDPQSATVGVAVTGLRIFIAMLPFLSINLMGVAYFQSVAKGKASMFLGVIRQFLALVPLVLLLPSFFGLNGVWYATPIADAVAIVVTGIFLLRDLKDQTPNQVSLNAA